MDGYETSLTGKVSGFYVVRGVCFWWPRSGIYKLYWGWNQTKFNVWV